MKNSSCPCKRLHSRALVNSQNARDDGDPVRVGKQAAEHKVPCKPREKWPPVILLDLGACGFHQLAVLDARRTCRLARAAIQALIDMFDEGFAEREPPLVDQHHLTDSPAGRISFQPPEFICRTIIQTQPAMNAARVIVVGRSIGAGKSAYVPGSRRLFRS